MENRVAYVKDGRQQWATTPAAEVRLKFAGWRRADTIGQSTLPSPPSPQPETGETSTATEATTLTKPAVRKTTDKQ